MKKQSKADKAFVEKVATLWVKPGLKKGTGGKGFTTEEKAFAQKTADATGCPVLMVRVGLARPKRRDAGEESFAA